MGCCFSERIRSAHFIARSGRVYSVAAQSGQLVRFRSMLEQELAVVDQRPQQVFSCGPAVLGRCQRRAELLAFRRGRITAECR